MVYKISGSETYIESFLGLTAKVQDGDPLKTISDALEVVEEMIRIKHKTREVYLKAMPIIPTSNEMTADKAAKFASKIDKLSVEMCNNELSPASIGDLKALQESVLLKISARIDSRIPLLARPIS